MAKYPQYVLEDMKVTLKLDFEDFINFLKILRPKTEDDKIVIDTTIDMFEQMYDDVMNAKSLSDIKPWFNVTELVDDWDDIRNNMSTNFSKDVQKMIEFIIDSSTTNPEE